MSVINFREKFPSVSFPSDFVFPVRRHLPPIEDEYDDDDLCPNCGNLWDDVLCDLCGLSEDDLI